MRTLNTSERGLIAALVLSDIVSILLFIYNIFYSTLGKRAMIPIFLIIMPAIYLDTKKQLEVKQNKNFRYKKVLWVLMSCLIISESMNLILFIL